MHRVVALFKKPTVLFAGTSVFALIAMPFPAPAKLKPLVCKVSEPDMVVEVVRVALVSVPFVALTLSPSKLLSKAISVSFDVMFDSAVVSRVPCAVMSFLFVVI